MVTDDHVHGGVHDAAADARIRALEAELGTLQARLEHREALLRALNRRLFELERGANGITDAERVQAALVHQHNQQLEAELKDLNQLKQTKLYRWASPARSVYAMLRGRP